MIQITLDGKLIESEFDNLQVLLNNCSAVSHLLGKKYAIALNQNFVPKSEYPVTQLRHKDNLDIFIPIQGG